MTSKRTASSTMAAAETSTMRRRLKSWTVFCYAWVTSTAAPRRRKETDGGEVFWRETVHALDRTVGVHRRVRSIISDACRRRSRNEAVSRPAGPGVGIYAERSAD